MLSKYQRFIDKHGKIIFPLYFVVLFSVCLIPILYGIDNWNSYQMTGFPIYLGAPKVLNDIYTQVGVWSSYQEFVSESKHLFVILYTQFSLSWLMVICAIAFLIVFYAFKKVVKPLLIFIPLLFIIDVIIDIAEFKAQPFIGFYLMFVIMTFAILYCIKTPNSTESDSK